MPWGRTRGHARTSAGDLVPEAVGDEERVPRLQHHKGGRHPSVCGRRQGEPNAHGRVHASNLEGRHLQRDVLLHALRAVEQRVRAGGWRSDGVGRGAGGAGARPVPDGAVVAAVAGQRRWVEEGRGGGRPQGHLHERNTRVAAKRALRSGPPLTAEEPGTTTPRLDSALISPAPGRCQLLSVPQRRPTCLVPRTTVSRLAYGSWWMLPRLPRTHTHRLVLVSARPRRHAGAGASRSRPPATPRSRSFQEM